jgi:hypothetical protein
MIAESRVSIETSSGSPRRAAFPAVVALRPAAWILAAAGIFKTHADPDLWGHVRFGLDIARDRVLPRVDPYSFTQDVPWVNHEWLSELAMGAAFAAGGPAGLFVLKVLLVGATFVLLAGAVRHVPDHVRWPALALAIWGVLPLTTTIRPQLWTLLLVAGLCRILTGPPKYLLLLPPIFALWANVHGGWIVGIGVLFVWSVALAFEEGNNRPSLGTLAGVALASLVATLVNPYGWGLWEFLAATVRLSRVDISEWQPIWRDSLVTQFQWLTALAFIGAAARWLIRPHPATLGVLALLAFTSLRVNRLVPLFIVAAVILVGRRTAPRTDDAEVPRARTVIDLTAVAVATLLAVWVGAIPRCIATTGTWTPDPAAAQALRASRAEGRLITWFEWGEYAIWHLSPALKVSIDGRRETVYSEQTLREQLAIALGRPEGFAALERLAPEYVWLPAERSRPTAEWLTGHGYRLDVETERSFVAVRDDLPTVTPLPTGDLWCFPGP